MARRLIPLLGLALLLGLAPQQQTLQQTLDRAALEHVEELSESLANDLLELSVASRDRDRQAMAGHFAPLVRVRADGEPRAGDLEPQRQWLRRHGWSTVTITPDDEPAVREAARSEVLGTLGALLEHFSEVEDARFKVKAATFSDHSPPRGQARVKLAVIGRDAMGRREWLDGWLRVEAVSTGSERWEIDALVIESMQSLVAERDLFSEVALPAGVSRQFPDFGTPPNDTVVAHGAAAADIDHDGLIDVLATGVTGNRLYRNLGDGRFEDISAASLVGYSPPATGAAWFDADADGDQDLFLAALGPQMLLENRLVPEGVLQFVDVSAAAGIDVEAIGFSVAVADVNGDALADVYVASYNRYGQVMPNRWDAATNGTPNLLFLNQGNLRFREAAESWGVRDTRWSYAASFADVDGDGDQDLYVANDFGENGFFRNDGGTFRDVAADRGLLDPGNGMGVSFGDFNNDGHLDLHVTNMSSTAGNRILSRLFPEPDPAASHLGKLAAGNSVFRGDGDGNFVEVTAELGGISAGWAWGGGFLDFDNDGWEDVYTPNGFISGKVMKDT